MRQIYLGSLVLLVACSAPGEKESKSAPPTPTTIVAAPVTSDAAAAPGLCAGAAEDALRRHADAERVERSDVLDPLDVEGDGTADAVFRGRCGGFAGNCTFLIYRCTADGSTFLGEVVGFGFSGPFCVDPPTGGTPCRLSIDRRMMHDDLQEELYDHVNGEYTRTGTGRYIPPRQRGGKSPP